MQLDLFANAEEASAPSAKPSKLPVKNGRDIAPTEIPSPRAPPLSHPAQVNAAQAKLPTTPEPTPRPLPATQANQDGDSSKAPADEALAPSRSPPATLEEVRLRLLDLPPSRDIQHMRSALNTVARVLGRPLREIPAAPGQLGGLLESAAPAGARVKPERWVSVRSLTLKALRATGVTAMAGRDVEGLSPSWERALAGLDNMAARIGLMRPLSWFSRQGVEPADVCPNHFQEFHEALVTTSLVSRPEAAYRKIVRLWNATAGSTPSWPQIQVEAEFDPGHIALPWDAFPEAFRLDVDRYLRRGEDPNPFVDDGPSRAMSPISVKQIRAVLLRTASALVASGYPLEKVSGLATLTDPKNAEAALLYLLKRQNTTKSLYVANIARRLRSIAMHSVKSDEQAAVLARAIKKLAPRQTGMSEKNRERLRQFDSRENLDTLLHLPERILRQDRKLHEPKRPAAVRLENAVAIEMLTMAPMRIKNLTRLELGRHLKEFRSGRQRRWRLVVPGDETKNGKPFEAVLPEESCKLLQIYLDERHGMLWREPTKMLFPGLRGGRRSESAFGGALSDFIRRETGLVMNPHLFRHLAGLLYLREHPDGIETVRQFLGHTSAATTLRFYAELKTEQAVGNLDRTITERRRQLLTDRRQPRRKGGSR